MTWFTRFYCYFNLTIFISIFTIAGIQLSRLELCVHKGKCYQHCQDISAPQMRSSFWEESPDFSILVPAAHKQALKQAFVCKWFAKEVFPGETVEDRGKQHRKEKAKSQPQQGSTEEPWSMDHALECVLTQSVGFHSPTSVLCKLPRSAPGIPLREQVWSSRSKSILKLGRDS